MGEQITSHIDHISVAKGQKERVKRVRTLDRIADKLTPGGRPGRFDHIPVELTLDGRMVFENKEGNKKKRWNWQMLHELRGNYDLRRKLRSEFDKWAEGAERSFWGMETDQAWEKLEEKMSEIAQQFLVKEGGPRKEGIHEITWEMIRLKHRHRELFIECCPEVVAKNVRLSFRRADRAIVGEKPTRCSHTGIDQKEARKG
jgi:hypothetical protein